MRTVLIAMALSLGVSSVAFAVEGDAAAGKTKAAACFACHGQDGNSAAPTFPKLAGQNARYLQKQLHEINRKNDKGVVLRSIPAMTGLSENLSDQDIADIAAYFSTQKSSANQAKKELVAKGEAIYRGGVREKGVPACTGCHSPTGAGNAPAGFPQLGGQHADYIATQLKAYRTAGDGDMTGRANDGETKPMRTVALRLSDSEIAAVASFISGLQ